MLDIPAHRPASGAVAMLTRLLRDYGREHKWAYVASAAMMGVGATTTGIAAALLRPVLNGMATAEQFSEMRVLAFAVLGLFVLRGADDLRLAGAAVANRQPHRRRRVQRRVFDRLLQPEPPAISRTATPANSSPGSRSPPTACAIRLQLWCRASRATRSSVVGAGRRDDLARPDDRGSARCSCCPSRRCSSAG